MLHNFLQFGFPMYVLHNLNSHNFIHKKAKAQDEQNSLDARM